MPRIGPRVAASAAVLLALWASFGARADDGAAERAERRAAERALPPIVVTPSSYTIVRQAASAHDVDMPEVADLPLLDNDILRAVHMFPGVASNDFTARFHLRGGERSDVVVRLDGMELYEPFHLQDFGGPLSSIDRSLVSGATLLMGAYPASYGSAAAGVLDMTTRSPGREKRATVGLDLLKTMFLAEGAVGDGVYLFAARRGYIDLALALVDAIQPMDEKFRPRYTDLYTKVEFPLESGGSVTVSSLYGRDTNLIDKDGDHDDLDSAYENSVTWLRWRGPRDGRLSFEAMPYVGFAAAERVEGSTDWDGRDLTYAGARGIARLSSPTAHAVEAGAELRASAGVYDSRETISPFPELTDDPDTITVTANV
ncbi:TonB-dependent receptor plug domain-containing protein, partial [Candidatus Poribacteria bacterium]|nr:TonB-dependent receptor plug domain-containing protein [Candidatus Poribacteria bacterium]